MSDPYPFLPNGSRADLIRRIDSDLRKLNSHRIIINGREQYLSDERNADILKLRWDVKKLDGLASGLSDSESVSLLPLFLYLGFIMFQ